MQSRAKRRRVFVWRERRKQMLRRSFSLLLKRKQATMQFSPLVQRLITNPNHKVFIGYGYFVIRVKIKEKERRF